MRTYLTAVAGWVVVMTLAGVSIAGCGQAPQQPSRATSPGTASTGPTTSSNGPVHQQTVLPFTGLERPHDVAVDAAGNVFITDTATDQVIELAAGSNIQSVLPFTHSDLTAAPAGTVWIIAHDHEQLVKLSAGPNTQTVLPLPDLGLRGEVFSVDAAGNAYGTNGGGVDPGGGCCIPVRVVKSSAGSNAPTVLPFTDVLGVGGMAVDAAGNVYVGGHNQVLKLAAGSNTSTVLPLTGLNGLVDVAAVDSDGSVYVVDSEHNRVLKLTAGSQLPTVLPFTGLNDPVGAAVDTRGNVYVIDAGNHRVLKLEVA